MTAGYQRYRRGLDEIEILCAACAGRRNVDPNGACSDWLVLGAADGVDAHCDDCGAPIGPVTGES